MDRRTGQDLRWEEERVPRMPVEACVSVKVGASSGAARRVGVSVGWAGRGEEGSRTLLGRLEPPVGERRVEWTVRIRAKGRREEEKKKSKRKTQHDAVKKGGKGKDEGMQ
jgi:hypothetical protein